jgi:hypothetical protein
MLCVDTHKIQRNAALALSLVVALSIALSVALLLTVNVVSSLILVLINCSINRQSNLTEATQEAITMKNPLSALLLALLLTIPFTPVQAQIFPPIPVFDGATGVMKVPTLLFEGKPYYLEFSVADVAALTFKIEEDSLVGYRRHLGSRRRSNRSHLQCRWQLETIAGSRRRPRSLS